MNQTPKSNDLTSHVSIFPIPPWQVINKYSNATTVQSTTSKPPTPPGPLTYRMFGNYFNSDDSILRSLESQDVRRVYPQTYNRKRELRKLNFSILANYLDLLDIITRDPSSPKRPEKLDHLAILFINMHHLANEYRPHQARDLLREILVYQVKVATETVHKAEQYLERSDNLLYDTGCKISTHSSPSSLQNPVKADFSDLGPELAPLLESIQDSAELVELPGLHPSSCSSGVSPFASVRVSDLPVDRYTKPTIKHSSNDKIVSFSSDDEIHIKRSRSITSPSPELIPDSGVGHLDPVLWRFLVDDLASGVQN